MSFKLCAVPWLLLELGAGAPLLTCSPGSASFKQATRLSAKLVT
jgi:hypothetical protein